MKKNWKTILVAAALVGSVTGCARNATGGAFTGAALGGLAGSALTGGSTAGTLVGAVAGAAIGADVGAQLERADRERAANALRYRQDRETEVWVNPRSGVEYHYTPMRTYRSRSQTCRDYTLLAYVDGQPSEVHGTACLAADGTWRNVAP